MKNLFLETDLEALLPFVIMAALAAMLIGPVATSGYVWIAVAVMAVAQPMIFTRTFDNPKGDRIRYLLCNEILCAACIGTTVTIASMISR